MRKEGNTQNEQVLGINEQVLGINERAKDYLPVQTFNNTKCL